jgi:signal transduction histidine kinase
MTGWLRLHRHDVFDVVVAVALLAGSLADWATGALAGSYPGPRWSHLLFLVATALPLAVRRRRPLLALVVLGVVQTVWIDVLFPLDVQPPLIPFVQLLVVVYTAAAYCDGREARAAVAVFALGVASDVPTLMLGKPIGLVASPNIALAIAFLVGLGFARLRRRTEEQARALADAELERRAAAEQAAAAERARIARELHDVISHDVSLMVLQASVERRVHGADEATGQAFASIEAAGREALTELRRMLGVLRRDDEAAPLRPQPGLAQLPELVDQASAAGLPVRLVIVGTPVSVPPGLDIAAYRIVQESLTNAAKHAAGATVTATVRYTDGGIEIEVVDDGLTTTDRLPLPRGGHGLVGMRERVAVFGGTLEAARSETGGFRVHARLPVTV